LVVVAFWDSAEFIAPTAAKARYAAFRAYREEGYRQTFRRFLEFSHVHHLGRAERSPC
jgi:hypothetical protein